MKFKMVDIGMFKLPGVVIEKNEDEDDLLRGILDEVREWTSEHKIGKEINCDKNIWMFKNDNQRNFFIMRWG